MQNTLDSKSKGRIVYGSPIQDSSLKPDNGYGTAYQQSYGQPPQTYGQFQQTYGQPQQTYGQPQHMYGQPQRQYDGQATDYGKPYQPNSDTNASTSHYNQNYIPQSDPFGYPPKPSTSILVEEESIDTSKLFHHDTDILIRHGFIRKVYGVLFYQLAISFGIMAIFALLEKPKAFLISNSWLLYTSIGTSLAFLFTLVCCNVSRKVPINYILVTLFSIAEGVLLAYAALSVSTEGLLIAVGVTAVLVLALSLFACQTKYDFTGCGAFVMVSVLGLVILSLIGIFLRNKIFHVVISGIACLLMCFYIIYDTQQIVGGKGRQYSISIDDYVLGAITLYIDIVTLFLHLLSLIRFAENN